jgi:hypothetical protein
MYVEAASSDSNTIYSCEDEYPLSAALTDAHMVFTGAKLSSMRV